MTSDVIHVRGLRLWAHVGVLERERLHGQWFELAFSLGTDLSETACRDDLSDGSDYAIGIEALRARSRVICCNTLEHYSERILDVLEECYGPIPLALELTKCRPPIPGFGGSVTVRRTRRWE
ncbi:dihydroneopterin aldolase [Synechococcus sp. CCY 9618]|uniref:dihydroneopterin aldolase n=1 Tax=Synechococcus sp. CCY 9618 TaxID=2815602 RepID=UPI001C219FD6